MTTRTPTLGPHPFNKPSADVVLRSSDSVDFRVRSAILIEASPFFEDMFSLPQSENTSKEAVIVDVTEDSATLERVLRLCYPMGEMISDALTPKQTFDVLEAGLKYDINAVVAPMKRQLSSLRQSVPLLVYCWACRLQLEDEARSAAELLQDTVDHRFPQLTYIPEMESITAGSYQRLWRYATRTIMPDSPPVPFTFCYESSAGSDEAPSAECSPDVSTLVRQDLFPFDSIEADAVLVTSDDVHFRVHKAIISLASPVLADGLKSGTIHHETGLPHFRVPESSAMLDALLRLCYPCASPELKRATDIAAVLAAATKYRSPRALELARSAWDAAAPADPLRFYLVAAQHGFTDLAKQSARAALALDLHALRDAYVPEMEACSAGAYWRLLQFHRDCQDALERELCETPTHALPEVVARHPLVVRAPGNNCQRCYVQDMFDRGWRWNRYDEYMFLARSALVVRPSAATATSGAALQLLIQMVFDMMVSCPTGCRYRKEYTEELLSFSRALGQAVDDILAKVDLRTVEK